MGEFAVNIASSYQIGAARDNRTILSAMDSATRSVWYVQIVGKPSQLILHFRRSRRLTADTGGRLSRPDPITVVVIRKVFNVGYSTGLFDGSTVPTYRPILRPKMPQQLQDYRGGDEIERRLATRFAAS